jgi:hypothetical protein
MYETSFYLVLEFSEHDFAGLLSNVNVTFTLGEIKNIRPLSDKTHGGWTLSVQQLQIH